MMNRRRFLSVSALIIAAPAIVKAEWLMPVKPLWTPHEWLTTHGTDTLIDDWETEWRANVMARSKRLHAKYTLDLTTQAMTSRVNCL